jgi:hypothetical protein
VGLDSAFDVPTSCLCLMWLDVTWCAAALQNEGVYVRGHFMAGTSNATPYTELDHKRQKALKNIF